MMVLRNYKFEHEIIFSDGSINHLIIENPITLRDYILELKSQIDGESGDFVLSNDNQEFSLQKNILLLNDPICSSFDEKKINSKINKDILSVVKTSDFLKETNPLISLIEKYANAIIDDYGFNIDYELPDESALVKMLNFHLSMEYTTQIDKLLEWVNLNHDVFGIENFIIVNSYSYFTEEELSTFSSECTSLKHNILFIDSYNRYDFKNRIIIDNDNCELF